MANNESAYGMDHILLDMATVYTLMWTGTATSGNITATIESKPTIITHQHLHRHHYHITTAIPSRASTPSPYHPSITISISSPPLPASPSHAHTRSIRLGHSLPSHWLHPDWRWPILPIFDGHVHSHPSPIATHLQCQHWI